MRGNVNLNRRAGPGLDDRPALSGKPLHGGQFRLRGGRGADRQGLRAVGGNRNRVFEVGARVAVGRHLGPIVLEQLDLLDPHVDHRLGRDHQARLGP